MSPIGQILIYTVILLVGFVVGVGVTTLYYEREMPLKEQEPVAELPPPPPPVPAAEPVVVTVPAPVKPVPAIPVELRSAAASILSRPLLPKAPARPAPTPPEKPVSMVEQIDAILQAMLESSPLKDKSVHLVEDSHQGVVVWVGLEHYIGLDSVPDPQVTALLRAAVAEWERSASAHIKKL